MGMHCKAHPARWKFYLLILAVTLMALLLIHKSSSIRWEMLWHNTDTPSSDPTGYATTSIRRGFIVGDVYSGQQGSGVRAVLSLQCWASSFSLPMYIVEPYIESSSLGSRLKFKFKDLKNVMKFSDYFDMDHFNSASIEEGAPPLISVEDFIKKAPRQTIAVRLFNDPSCAVHPEFKVLEESGGMGRCCRSIRLDNWQMDEAKFCVVKVVQFRGCMSLPSAAKRMYKTIFQGWDPSNVTVVFWYWASNWDQLQNPDNKTKMLCRDLSGQKLRHKFYPSPRLLNDAKYYTDTYLRGMNTIAVMIRSEQAILGFRNGDNFKQLISCLNETVETARNVSNRSSAAKHGGIFLTLDIGKYGSNVIEQVLGMSIYNLQSKSSVVIRSIKEVVPKLYEGDWTFAEWEDSFVKATNGVENPGYIASLQRTIASRADCLILMGGGDFQRLALHDYLELHPETSQQCLKFICFTKSFQEQFSDIVQYEEEKDDVAKRTL